MVNSIEEAIAICDEKEESFIIGGGMVYKQFLPHAEKLYLTRIHKSFDADTFFPAINFDEWDEISREEFPESEMNEFAHSYIVYRRK
jgi:dihydrofolate reductase